MRKYEYMSNEQIVEAVRNLECLVDYDAFVNSPLFDCGCDMLEELKTEVFIRYSMIVDGLVMST